jgi:predicted HicB family RNase H-like nuclease
MAADNPEPSRATSEVHLRIPRETKARWVATASRDGKKLTAWIIEVLNANSSFDR